MNRVYRKFQCMDCRQEIVGFRKLQSHTRTEHQREPNCDKYGKARTPEIARYAPLIAAMNDGLTIAA